MMSTDKKMYKLLPPDGGYGYVIILAVFLLYGSTMSFPVCFGLIYKDFMAEINMGSTALTFMSGIQAFTVSLLGFAVGPLLKIMSKRILLLIGSTLYVLGTLSIYFANSVPTFIVSYGVVMSAGYGIIFNMGATITNDFFLKKRLFAVSLTQTLQAATGMVTPLFAKWCLDEYGFRGTVIMVTAIGLHAYIAVALIQPIASHMKKVMIPETELNEAKVLLEEKINNMDAGYDHSKINYPQKNNNKEGFDEKKRTSIRKKVMDFLEYEDLKPFLLSSASVFPMLCLFVEGNFMLMFPQCLQYMEWQEDKIALALTLLNIGDFLTRILFIIFSKYLIRFKYREIYLMGLLIAVITRYGMLYTENSTLALILITLTGFTRCITMILAPLVIAESVPSDKFASAMGTSMLMLGIASLGIGPAIGAVRDITNSFKAVFYVLASLNALSLIVWCIELFCKRKTLRSSKSLPEK